MLSRSLPLVALAGALALAACNKAPPVTTDNAMVDTDNAADLNGSAFNDEAPAIENTGNSGTAAVEVLKVPTAAPDTSTADAAPLEEARAIESDIRAGGGVERIRYGDGWAWRRDGQILRTADRDGRKVAYFRHGETNPFLVQRGDTAFTFHNNSPQREFDRDGRARAPTPEHARDAEQAQRDARDQRDRAQHAHDDARNPPVQPTPTPAPTGRGHDRDHGPRPSPTPTPTPTDDGHHRGDRNQPDQRDRPQH